MICSLILLFIVSGAVCETPKRQYVVAADFFKGIKAKEYSIYDQAGQHLQYRMESKYGFLQSVELIAYPAKTVIGKLKANLKLLVYNGNFELYDQRTQQWSKGNISQKFQLAGDNWTIEWDHHHLSMETEPISLTTSFYDKQHNHNHVAKFRLRPQSFIWTLKYDMEIYSDIVPDGLYFLCLAAKDQLIRRSRG